jgi:hypothetical protein
MLVEFVADHGNSPPSIIETPRGEHPGRGGRQPERWAVRRLDIRRGAGLFSIRVHVASATPLTPSEFAAKWRGVTTGERASAQSHFGDLCRMLGEPTPTDADPTGSWYAFEKGAEKFDGRDGFADVWKKGFFAWEYKGKRKDLRAAYRQLVDYKDALENPPLLVVSDLERIEVHTNFTGLSPRTYTVTLDDLAAPDPSEPLRILRAVFTEPEALRPTFDRAELTEAAARHFAELAGALHARGHAPQAVAHFLDKLLFCLFAEDTGLLPKGLLSRLADATRSKPDDFGAALGELFGRMAAGGGMFVSSPSQPEASAGEGRLSPSRRRSRRSSRSRLLTFRRYRDWLLAIPRGTHPQASGHSTRRSAASERHALR